MIDHQHSKVTAHSLQVADLCLHGYLTHLRASTPKQVRLCNAAVKVKSPPRDQEHRRLGLNLLPTTHRHGALRNVLFMAIMLISSNRRTRQYLQIELMLAPPRFTSSVTYGSSAHSPPEQLRVPMTVEQVSDVVSEASDQDLRRHFCIAEHAGRTQKPEDANPTSTLLATWTIHSQ